MGRNTGRHQRQDDGSTAIRGRSSTRRRTRSASGARGHSRSRPSASFGHRWECWGHINGKKCGRECVGLQPCPRCGRQAPNKAWDVANAEAKRSSGLRAPKASNNDNEVAKLRRELAQAKNENIKDNLKRDREVRELRAAVAEARVEAPAASQDAGAAEHKDQLKQDIEKLQSEIKRMEALELPYLGDIVAEKKRKLATLSEQRVLGQPTPVRLRGIEAAITRRDKAMDAVANEMVDLDEELIRLGAELEKKRLKYAEHQDHIRKLQIERAGLLDQQAQEARGPMAAAALEPAVVQVPAQPTFEQAWAVLKGVHDECSGTDEERDIVARIGLRVVERHQQQQMQQQQQLTAAAADGQIPVPSSPRGDAAELVGEAAAAGRDEHSQRAGGTAPEMAATPSQVPAAATGGGAAEDVPASVPAAQPEPPTQPLTQDIVMATAPAGNVLDREPLSAAQAMEAIKRRRLKK